MKKKAALLLFLILSVSLCLFVIKPVSSSNDVAENTWESKAPVPTGTRFGVAVVNGKIYAIGGYTTQGGGSTFSNMNQFYDPANDAWTNILAPMPIARRNFGIAVYQDKIYVIGGENRSHAIPGPNFVDYSMDGVTGVIEVYDIATNTWGNKTPMPTPRNYLQANVVDGKIYLIGGLSQQKLEYPSSPHSSNLTEVYDILTDSWTTMLPIPTPVWGYASAVVNDKIYIISGWCGNSSSSSRQSASLSNQVQIFDPKTNTWSQGKPIPTPIVLAGAGATTGVVAPKRIYVVGGCPIANTQLQGGINATQVYNPQTDTWSSGAEMPTKRSGLAVAVVNDVLYALGGADLSLTNANEQYAPIGYGTPEPTPSSTPTPSIQPTTGNIAIVVTLAIIAVAGSGLIIYLKRRRH
jgi:N-acetylneuraminic acid mutarotase